MNTDRDLRYLTYIRDSIDLIETRALSGPKIFFSDLKEQDAVLWRLYTLADASNQLSQASKERHPEIPWRRIAGFRNIAAHGYLELLLEAAWEIIDVHLTALKAAVGDELSRM